LPSAAAAAAGSPSAFLLLSFFSPSSLDCCTQGKRTEDELQSQNHQLDVAS
jgi:hypothetical protein